MRPPGENDKIVVLSADSGGSSGLGAFKKEYPARYFETGIMEQGAVGIASGLATVGKIPVFCAIAPFVTSRPYEMFRNDLGYMRQNVKIVGRNSGISYSDLGSTHHSLEDFAIIRMIPGVVVLAPQDPDEIREAVKAMLAHEGPVYMRIGNEPIPSLFEPEPFVIGQGKVVTEGTSVTIVTTGSIAAQAIEAAGLLKEQGISAEVLSVPTVAPLDKETDPEIGEEDPAGVHRRGNITSSAAWARACRKSVSENCPVPVKKIGLPHGYVSSGPYQELLAYYKLDAKGIAGDHCRQP